MITSIRATTLSGGWSLTRIEYNGRRSNVLVHEDRGITDYPVLYRPWEIAYDRPEKIPERIKRQTTRVLTGWSKI